MCQGGHGMKGQESVQSTRLYVAREERKDEKHLQQLKVDFCRRLGMVVGDHVPVASIRNRDGSCGKNQIPSAGAQEQQKSRCSGQSG